MKQNKEYIVLLNKANNVDYSDELYVYHNVYLGKFLKHIKIYLIKYMMILIYIKR